MKKIEILQSMIDEANRIVFFGGAGVSTDSGIKDFRGKNGLYKEMYKYPPEYMLSSRCFYRETEEFYKYYKVKMNSLGVKPNSTHKYLKRLEDSGKLKAIVTQNIDGLHQEAGNKFVYELHGSIYRNYCLECNKFYDAHYVFGASEVPKCECGGVIKPDVVLYGEMLPSDVYCRAQYEISEADMLIVAGTSLTVEPASSMVNLFRGKYLVIINNDKTCMDSKADLVINENLESVFSRLK